MIFHSFFNIYTKYNHTSLSIHLLSIILSLLPFFLAVSPFLSDFTISILGIFLIFYIFKNNYFFFFKNYFVVFFFFFYFYILVLSLLSENILLSLESSLFYFRFIFFVLCVRLLYEENKNLVKILLTSLISILVFIFLDSLYQFIYGNNLLNYSMVSPGRVSSIFGDELKLGSFYTRFVLIFFALYAINKTINLKDNFYLFLILIINLFIVFISGERASLIIFMLFFIYIFLEPSFNKFFKFVLFVLAISSAFLLILNSSMIKKRMIDQTLLQRGLKSETKYEKTEFTEFAGFQFYLFSPSHQKIYFNAVKIYNENKLFGHGPKTFRYLCVDPKYNLDPKGCTTHPHNTYIQLLLETGLIGFFAVLLFFLICTYKILKSLFLNYFRTSDLNLSKRLFYLCLIISLLPFIPTGSFFNNWLSIIYFFPIGFIISDFDFKIKT